jgi:hypothetical protein
MAYSKAKLKSSGDKTSPCFRPFSVHNKTEEKKKRKSVDQSKVQEVQEDISKNHLQ